MKLRRDRNEFVAHQAGGDVLPRRIRRLKALAAGAVVALGLLGGSVSQSAASEPRAQTIKFTSNAPTAATVGGPTYQVGAVASSGLPVALTIDPSSSSVCAISGATVSFIGAGTCTIDANQPGGGEFGPNEYVEPYSPAPQVQQSFTVSAPATVTVVPGPTPTAGPPPTPPNSNFNAGASSFEPKTGRVVFIETITDPGTFTWRLTIPNGKFGVFASSKKCKTGLIRLGGRCRPSTVIFSTGSATVPAGVVIFKLRPSPSALTALKNALKRKKGIPVTATFTFQSSHGGSPVTHTQRITDRLKKK